MDNEPRIPGVEEKRKENRKVMLLLLLVLFSMGAGALLFGVGGEGGARRLFQRGSAQEDFEASESPERDRMLHMPETREAASNAFPAQGGPIEGGGVPAAAGSDSLALSTAKEVRTEAQTSAAEGARISPANFFSHGLKGSRMSRTDAEIEAAFQKAGMRSPNPFRAGSGAGARSRSAAGRMLLGRAAGIARRRSTNRSVGTWAQPGGGAGAAGGLQEGYGVERTSGPVLDSKTPGLDGGKALGPLKKAAIPEVGDGAAVDGDDPSRKNIYLTPGHAEMSMSAANTVTFTAGGMNPADVLVCYEVLSHPCVPAAVNAGECSSPSAFYPMPENNEEWTLTDDDKAVGTFPYEPGGWGCKGIRVKMSFMDKSKGTVASSTMEVVK